MPRVGILHGFFQTATERQLARYPQLYSRIGFAHHYLPLGSKDIPQALAQHWSAQCPPPADRRRPRANGPMHSATSRPSSRPPPLSLSPPASTRRSVRSLPKPASGSGPSIATSRPARTSSWPSTGTRSKPSPKRVPHLLAEVGSPVAALGQWLDVFVDFLTKHGLAAALRSDSAGFYGLHAYFLDRLVPVCEQLLDAAENAGGEIRYARVSTSGRWVFFGFAVV